MPVNSNNSRGSNELNNNGEELVQMLNTVIPCVVPIL